MTKTGFFWYSLLYSIVRKRHKTKPKEDNGDYYFTVDIDPEPVPVLAVSYILPFND